MFFFSIIIMIVSVLTDQIRVLAIRLPKNGKLQVTTAVAHHTEHSWSQQILSYMLNFYKFEN